MKLRNLTSKTLLCLCLVLSLVMCSCSGGNMTDESVRAELERLLPLSYEMNEIFWGKGLAFNDDGSNNRFMTVTEDCEYKTIEEIITKASEVFSEEYIAIIRDAIFTNSDDIDPRYIDVDGKLMADKNNKGFNIKGNIKIDSAVIKKQNRGMVLISAEYEDGGKTELTLVLQDGKWFLNSPTY